MRRHLRKFLPDHDAIRNSRWLAPFESTLLHPRLWHLNRHSAAGAVAVGMFCGLIPGPFQMLGAAICAVIFKVNLPLALFSTLYTNPVTIVPLYVVAFAIGKFALGLFGWADGAMFVTPPEYGDAGLIAWVEDLGDWVLHLGKPLMVGLVLLASLLAIAGYLATRFAYRIYLVRAWRHRAARRHRPKDSA